jgi:hypothetical protein
MVVGEGTHTRRQIKAIPHNKSIMAMAEEVEGECRPGEAEGEDRCRGPQQLMGLEVDTIKEVVGKAEGIPLTAVLSPEEGGQHR